MINVRYCLSRAVVVIILICISAAPTARADSFASGIRARNIIIMIGDGMGYNHVAAAAFYAGGKRRAFAFQRFPVRAGVSTWPLDGGYDPVAAWASFAWVRGGATDSAAAATALATGHKTVNGAIGVDASGRPIRNLLEAAEQQGKATGVVTTVEWSHATPAGFVAHDVSRSHYEAIAREMIEESACEVIMGAGHPYYTDDGVHRESAGSYQFVGGDDTWEALVAGSIGADADGDGKPDHWRLVQTRAEIRALMRGSTPKRVVATLQVATTLQQARTSTAGNATAENAPYSTPRNPDLPSLSELSLAAINVLDDDPDGFCLMIEGGAIDWAAHANQSARVIEETIDFAGAVDAVTGWIDTHGGWEENLLIVTADHETGYLTGPGSDPAWTGIVNHGKGNLPGMEWHSGGHTNSLVPFFARGAGSQHFSRAMKGKDPARGKYLDNTAIARQIFPLLK